MCRASNSLGVLDVLRRRWLVPRSSGMVWPSWSGQVGHSVSRMQGGRCWPWGTLTKGESAARRVALPIGSAARIVWECRYCVTVVRGLALEGFAQGSVWKG
jgi:hypothetical protein